MVGNVSEWVADWADLALLCTDWTSQTGIAGGDFSCFGGDGGASEGTAAGELRIPGAVIRGGAFGTNTFSGVFAASAGQPPTFFDLSIGFRCAR
jgi:formylglycine-generating enzyme required for sulfatase activity